MSVATPDPVDFALAVLAARGALVERDGEAGFATCDADLVQALGLPPEARLVATAAAGSDDVACGLGSTALERLLQVELATTPVAVARPELEAPRASQAQNLATRFAPRNGLAAAAVGIPSEATYLVVDARWVVDADERHEGLVRVAVATRDGAEPHAAALARWFDGPMVAVQGTAAPALDHGIAAMALERARSAATVAFEQVVNIVRRRHLRDHHRIVGYFNALITEAKHSSASAATP